jgi:hypothetical protein
MDVLAIDGLRQQLLAFPSGGVTLDEVEASLRWLAPVLRDPCQQRPRDASAR